MHTPTIIHVELFGIPSERAGVAETTAAGSRLGEVLADLAGRFPQLASDCFSQGRFQAGCLASINGDRFITDLGATLQPGDRLLLLSADAGG